MQTLASKLAFPFFAIALFGAAFTLTATSADASPGRITKLSGTDLGSGR